MKRFNACINGGTYINVEATRMELVACVDISTVMTAHISERGELCEKN